MEEESGWAIEISASDVFFLLRHVPVCACLLDVTVGEKSVSGIQLEEYRPWMVTICKATYVERFTGRCRADSADLPFDGISHVTNARASLDAS